MINYIKKFIVLPSNKKMLIIEVFIIMGFSRFLILFIPFRILASKIGEKMNESSKDLDVEKVNTALSIGRVIEKLSNFTPWESKCLVQAITVSIMLKRRKISSTLYLGIARKDKKSLNAHAWIRCGNAVITGYKEMKGFNVVAKFASIPNLDK